MNFKPMLGLSAVVVMAIGLSACSYNFHLEDGDAARLAKLLSGEFSSAAQAESSSDYFPVHLSVTPIWQDRYDGHWLYVEQALESKLNEPYRQRVYHVYRLLDEVFVSEIYTINDPQTLVGTNPKALESLSLDDIQLKPGCSVFLHTNDAGGFSGTTQGKGCASNLQGAHYATSEVVVSNRSVTSWDRGYDRQDQQVWGATLGPYVFLRQ